MTLRAGAALADGRYRLDRPLGAGGMASVWLAHDRRLDRPVAIKIVADAPAGDPQWATRFTREARAAAAVEHPNVVTVYDHGLEDGRPFLVMAHVPGRDLARLLREADLPVPDPERLALELLGALGAVHRAGIVHRDVKAANVLVDAEGHAHLADFGIARTEGSSPLTQVGMVIGTLEYLAPEVAEGRPATVASDLFAAGVVLREIAAVAPSDALDRLADALTRSRPEDRPSSAVDALRILVDPAGAPEHHRTAPTRIDARLPRDEVPRGRPLSPVGGPGDAGARRPRTGGGRSPEPVPDRPGTPTGVPGGAVRAWARRDRRAVGAVVALVAVVVLVVLVAAVGSSGDGSKAVPRPASSVAPLTEQLRSLRSIVDGVPR
ncbi:serine/threonine-protein kinase [Patulibacter minatonensis]|uniref:serine/threonine-protein kinase n=1 Tax=Patulibacter minatonensis TaxID=298163 RepID=UPI000685C760|nr:serine/threonine-protein kinase [Patulibacter minatonensis]